MTAWTEFVKKYAGEKGITYKNALKDPECKKEYHSSKMEGGILGKPTKLTKAVGVRRKKVMKPLELIPQSEMSGEGLVIEGAEGFENIYPITHEMIVKIAQRC